MVCGAVQLHPEAQNFMSKIVYFWPKILENGLETLELTTIKHDHDVFCLQNETFNAI